MLSAASKNVSKRPWDNSNNVSRLDPSTSLEESVQTDIKAVKNLCCVILQIERVLGGYSENQAVVEKLNQLLDSLKLLEKQIIFIKGVLNSTSDKEISAHKLQIDNKNVLLKYRNLNKIGDVARVPLADGMDFLMGNLLFEASDLVGKIFEIFMTGEIVPIRPEDKIYEIQLVAAKLQIAHTYLPELVTFDRSDLVSLEKTSECWKKLAKFVTYKSFVQKGEINDSLKNLYRMFNLGYAVVSGEINEDEQNRFKSMLSQFQNIVSYNFKFDLTKPTSTLCLHNLKVEDIAAVWNLFERPFFKSIMKFSLPSRGFDKKIYIDRLFPIINKELILSEYHEETLHDEEELHIEYKQIDPDVKAQILENLENKDLDKVQIRVISSESMKIRRNTFDMLTHQIMRAKNIIIPEEKSNQAYKKPTGVVIHIHGGAFVSSSSSSHRNYLIRWAKGLERVIFSIDYRHALKNPYPAALDDVWQAYLWIINYSETILGINTDKIILVGDCSGGNLALALCLRLIKAGLKLPDGCVLIYPILNLDSRKFSPSYFWGISDPVLPYNLLKPCIEAYTNKKFDPKSDPYLSPLVASDIFLSKLPALRIIIGSNDPLYDDAWRFIDRLRKVGKEPHITVHKRLFHGFLRAEDLKSYEILVAHACGLIRECF